jgi:lysophospholipase L1-like esterase
MKRILVFGDSNSWGFVPRADGSPTTRYDRDTRWPSLMASLLGPEFEVLEEALSGRTTNLDDPHIDLPTEHLRGAAMNGARFLPVALASHLPLDLVIIMLGTNDLKKRFDRSPSDIAIAAISLAELSKECKGGVGTQYPSPRVLLIAPPPLGKVFQSPDEWKGGPEKSVMLGALYKDLALSAGLPFLDAGKIVSTDGSDSIHFSAATHRILGASVAEKVKSLRL